MLLVNVLADFKTAVAQCESLIANAHKEDANGVAFFPEIDQRQITIAAFLNIFIAWETFIKSSLISLMIGEQTLSGVLPVKHVSPPNEDIARQIIIGSMRFFDYGDHMRVKAITNIYFDGGYPYEPHVTAILTDLSDIRTMRNSCAHITSTTQRSLEALAMRIFSHPMPNIDLYRMLTAIDPRSPNGDTVLVTYREKLVVAAELIVQG